MLHRCQWNMHADNLPAIERRGFFATHRGLLELPQVWEAIIHWLDAGAPGDKPSSHPIEASVIAPNASAAAVAAASGGAAVAGGAAERHAARRRHNAALRAEGEARAKPHREKWHASAAAMRRSGKAPRGGHAESHEMGDWVFVNKSGRNSIESDGVTVVNPLHA
jgi:hypothetical protein